jgi:hypothetical protein
VRVVPSIGTLGAGGLARRGGEAVAQLLGVEPAIFPGDHGGFAANEWSPDNDPAAFAATLREVLGEDLIRGFTEGCGHAITRGRSGVRWQGSPDHGPARYGAPRAREYCE